MLVDEPVLLEEGTELEEDVRECRCRIDLLLCAFRCGGRGKEGRVKGVTRAVSYYRVRDRVRAGPRKGKGQDKGRGM